MSPMSSPPPVPRQLLSILHHDFTGRGNKGVSLPSLSLRAAEPRLQVVPPFQKKDAWEILVWLCLFAASRLSPYHVQSSGDGMLNLHDDDASVSSPLDVTAASLTAPSTRAGSMRRPPSSAGSSSGVVGEHSAADGSREADDAASISSHSGDAWLPIARQHAVAAFRALKVLVSPQRLGFTADALHKWATSPMLFGPDVKRVAQLIGLPRDKRLRRDRPYRSFMSAVLEDDYCLWYVWYACGLHAPILAREKLICADAGHDSRIIDLGGDASFVQSPRGSVHRFGLSTSSEHLPPSSASMRRAQLEEAAAESAAVGEMCAALLRCYTMGYLDCLTGDDLAALTLTLASTGGVHLFQERVPSLPLRDFAAAHGRTLTTLHATSCGLLSVEGLEDCRSLTSVRLSDNRLRSLPPTALVCLEELKLLYLDSNLLAHMEDLVGPSGAELTSLEVLCLQHNVLTQMFIDAVLPPQASESAAVGPACPRLRLPNLEVLDVSGNVDIVDLRCGASGIALCLPRLRTLRLRGLHHFRTGLVADISAQIAVSARSGDGRKRPLAVTLPLIPSARVGGSKRLRERGAWTFRNVAQLVCIAQFCLKEMKRIAACRFLHEHLGARLCVGAGAAAEASTGGLRRKLHSNCDSYLRGSHTPHHLLTGAPPAKDVSPEGERALSRYATRRSSMMRLLQ